MAQFGDGPWKEGRAGAASLCYVGLDEGRLAGVAERHGGVGIRATVVVADAASADPLLRELAERNWDIAHGSLPETLPLTAAPHDADELMRGIEAVVGRADWAVWRIDAAALDALGDAGHERLMRWLGEHHGRIWCAPVRDVAEWRSRQP
jgi:hypothetical protein